MFRDVEQTQKTAHCNFSDRSDKKTRPITYIDYRCTFRSVKKIILYIKLTTLLPELITQIYPYFSTKSKSTCIINLFY